MNSQHRQAFQQELTLARRLLHAGQLAPAFHHLERAHVLGQRYVVPHVVTHWLMLRLELRRRAPLAALGQGVRILLGALGSALGRVPVGNTGGSNVNMFAPMPIPEELSRLMEERRTP
jgi:hypothetical protein